MTQVSDDGFWQNIDGEWVPTQKQLDAVENGSIPYESNEMLGVNSESNPSTDHLFQIQPTFEVNNSSGTQDYIAFLGYVLIVFGVLDFVLAVFIGTNITFFLGFLSYFTSIFFWALGGYFVANKENLPWFDVEKFSESNQAKMIYAGTVAGALVLLLLLAGLAGNDLDENLIGTWTNPVDELVLDSNGDVTESTGTFESWYIDDGNLIFEEGEYYYVYKYTIADDILFLAPFDADDNLLEEDCVAYIEGSSGKTNSIFSDKIDAAEQSGDFPTWCQPE